MTKSDKKIEEKPSSEDKNNNQEVDTEENKNISEEETIENKLKVVQDLCNKECISLNEIAYIGDDINCFGLLSNVGIAACPSNAVKDIKLIPNIIQLESNGGEGVVREFAELMLG